MNLMMQLFINTEELFDRLPSAPIVEAVIDIRTRSGSELEETSVKAKLADKLDGYQFLDSQRGVRIQHEFRAGNEEQPLPEIRDLGWKGLRYQSDDKKHIVQFNRDGFVFSRLEPYESWDSLYVESMRLWQIYIQIAQPDAIDRIGLRYINRILPRVGLLNLEDYFVQAPTVLTDLDLPFAGFMHQDTLSVPGYPYAINVVRTIQPSVDPINSKVGLILDIDVFMTKSLELNEEELKNCLLEMRWLKNKVFYGSLTPSALALCNDSENVK